MAILNAIFKSYSKGLFFRRYVRYLTASANESCTDRKTLRRGARSFFFFSVSDSLDKPLIFLNLLLDVTLQALSSKELVDKFSFFFFYCCDIGVGFSSLWSKCRHPPKGMRLGMTVVTRGWFSLIQLTFRFFFAIRLLSNVIEHKHRVCRHQIFVLHRNVKNAFDHKKKHNCSHRGPLHMANDDSLVIHISSYRPIANDTVDPTGPYWASTVHISMASTTIFLAI